MRTLVALTFAAAFSPAFEKFKRDFGKEYATAEEEAKRFAIFERNVEKIAELNKEHKKATFAVNAFSDLTADEFGEQYMSGFAAPSSSQLWGTQSLGRDSYSGVELPASVAWDEDTTGPVKNQGQCGSCWSFSATGAAESRIKLATGTLTLLSQQQLVDCAQSYGNNGCNGGSMDGAFRYMEATAMCDDTEYPYEGKGGHCKASTCSTVAAGTITGFRDVDHDTSSLQEAVSKGPVSIAIEADKGVFQHYQGGVLSSLCGDSLDHGVLLVGYGTEDGTDYWKVKNSWGSAWGEEGYINLERGKGGTGECGLLKMASYPVAGSSAPTSPTPTTPTPFPEILV